MAGVSTANQRKGLLAAYMVTSASLQRMQPLKTPTLRATLKERARKLGLQRDEGSSKDKRPAGALDRERGGGFIPTAGKNKTWGPSCDLISQSLYSPVLMIEARHLVGDC